MGPRYTAFSDASYHKFHDNIPLKVLSCSDSPFMRWAPTKGGIGPAFILKRQLVFWMLSEIEEPLFFPVVLFFSSKRLSSPSSLSVWGDSNQQGTMGGATVSTGGGGYDSGMRSITSHTSCSGTGGTCSTIDVDDSPVASFHGSEALPWRIYVGKEVNPYPELMMELALAHIIMRAAMTNLMAKAAHFILPPHQCYPLIAKDVPLILYHHSHPADVAHTSAPFTFTMLIPMI